ncbi:MAG: M48 family metalloprotease [Pyrinomonadaceae bacterium]
MKKFYPCFALSFCAMVFLAVTPVASTQSPVASTQPKLKEMRIFGYITEFHSPTSFEIEDYRINRDQSVMLEFVNHSPGVHFRMEDLRVGTLVEVSGLYNEATKELNAWQVKVDLEQFRELDVTSILDRVPPAQLEQTKSGWRGIIVADGRRIRLGSTTQLVFKATKAEMKSERNERKKGEATKRKPKRDDWKKVSKTDWDDSWATGGPFKWVTLPIKSLADIGPGTTMEYHGLEQADGTVWASKIEFWRNELGASLWKDIKIREEPFNSEIGKPSELKVGAAKYQVLPNEEVQQYVNWLGQSLVPEYMKRLPEYDAQKITFQFRVIQAKGFNATAYPNGMIVIHSDVFEVLENEAQLAAIIGHEIAHATQEHTYRQLQLLKKQPPLEIGSLMAQGFGYYSVSEILNMVSTAMVNGYERTLENQADRVGLQYMADAGYDPREAPRVWKLVAKQGGDRPTFYWSSHDGASERRSFLMVAIKNGFSEENFEDFIRNEEQFRYIARLVREASVKERSKLN